MYCKQASISRCVNVDVVMVSVYSLFTFRLPCVVVVCIQYIVIISCHICLCLEYIVLVAFYETFPKNCNTVYNFWTATCLMTVLGGRHGDIPFEVLSLLHVSDSSQYFR